ncbi:hypothetical protein CIL02_04115 [Prevotella sp. P3-122]|nr:hypothetical protein CIL02_04115 [Prevotella sp. P3-122]
MFANAFIANAQQSYKKIIRIKTLFVIDFVKTEILVQLCHYNDQTISQYVKSIVHDTRNRVNDGMKCVGKGLWHKNCIIHYRKKAETAFLALLCSCWYIFFC